MMLIKLKILFIIWFILVTSSSRAADNKTSNEKKDSITLSVRDNTAGELRCSIILAHFVTQTPTLSNRRLELTFDRDQLSGTLAEKTSDNGMLVENIICGDKDAWQDTVSDIPLTLLRSSQANHFIAYCQIESRLHCRVREQNL